MDVVTISIILDFVAAMFVLYAFWLYNQNGGKISTGTWSILFIGDALELASYFGMTEVWWKNIVPLSFALGSIATFFLAFVKGRFSWPEVFDWLVVVLDAAILIVWNHYGSATLANLLYQATAVTAFLPMYRGLIKGREQETALPWVLWSAGFSIFFFASLIEHRADAEIVYPLTGLLTHLAVVVIVLSKKKGSLR